MTYIVSYQKHFDALTSKTIVLPENPDGHGHIGTELATIDGITFVALPDGAVLPEQPVEITVSPVDLTPELKVAISDASPHVRLIRERVSAMIADRYSVGDEIKLLRTAPSAEFEAYNAYAESCRQWGREQKARLGV